MDFQEDIVRLEAQLLQRASARRGAVAFKKTVFDWEVQLLQKAVLDAEALAPFQEDCSTGRSSCSSQRCWTRRRRTPAFKKTVFDWEAQLLQKAVLDEERWTFKKTVFDWEASCSRRRCWTRRRLAFKKTVFDWEAQLLEQGGGKSGCFKKTLFDWEVQLLQ